MDKIKVYSSSTSSYPKGSYENPYTYKEYDDIMNSGEDWPGGYVVGLGYVAADTIITGSWLSDDSWFDSWEDSSYSDPWSGSSSEDNFGSSQETGAGGGNHGSSGGSAGGPGSTIELPGKGNGENSTSNKGVPDVLSKSQFISQQKTDDCLETCNKMLRNVNCATNGVELLLMNPNANGRPTNPTADFSVGVNYIENQLKQGKPVIVAVDYRDGTSLKNFPNRKDQAADHFVVIVGGSLTAGFHYFDPATKNIDRGTSANNRFTLKDGVLKSTNVCTGSTKYYTLTSLRKNK